MSLHNAAVSAAMQESYPFLSLVRPIGGVVRKVSALPSQEMHVPKFASALAELGNLTMAFPQVTDYFGGDLQQTGLAGCGSDETRELAIVRAVAEAAERYATCVFADRDVTVASFKELGDEGVAVETLPRCSGDEYADPMCPLRPVDPAAAIRWFPGYSLTAQRPRLLPLIMTHLFMRPWEGERFWLPITTGVAAHTDPVRAAVSAICEVVERDAIALIWLLRLALPRIWFDEPAPSPFSEKFARLEESGLTQLFFDATSDVGVPTVYGLQLKDEHPTSAQFVNCSADFDVWASCAKIVRESAMGRTVLERGLTIPDDPSNFSALEHGAVYMGRWEHRDAFAFLTGIRESVPVSSLKPGMPQEPAVQLRFLVARLAALGMEVILADLATDELRDAGLHVIRAVIPGLMPMTSSGRARYLGHERLVRRQAELAQADGALRAINPFPQPFA